MYFETIITSAVTAAIVSGVSILINGWLDRRFRKKDLLFNLAFRIAKERQDLIKEIAKDTNRPAIIEDTMFYAETYYKWIDNLYENGKLPEGIQKTQ